MSRSSISLRIARCALPVLLITQAACSTVPKPEPKSESEKRVAVTSIETAKVSEIHDVPNQDTAFNDALAALKDGNLKQAEKIFLTISQQAAVDPAVYDNLGIIYFRSERLDEALQAFQKAIGLDENDHVAYGYLGIVYRNMGRFMEAQTSYTSALKIKPDYLYAHYNLAMLYDIYLGNPALAIYHYSKYLELSGSDDQKVRGWLVDLQQRVQSAPSVIDRDPP